MAAPGSASPVVDAIPERLEQRESHLAVRERMGRRARRAPGRRSGAVPASLTQALATASVPSPAELRWLAEQVLSAPVVSCYLRFGPARAGHPRAHLARLRSLVDTARERHARELAALPPWQRARTLADLEHLIQAVDELEPAGARALVAFRSGEALNVAYLIPVKPPGPDRVVIGPDAYLMPLAALLEEHPPILVVQVAKRDARVLVATFGRLDEVEHLTSFATGDRVDVARPGKIQRHRLTHLQWHLRDTAHAASVAYREHGCAGLVLVGDEPITAAFTEFLPTSLARAVIGRLPQPVSHAALAERVRTHVSERQRATETRWADELASLAAANRLVTGLAAVIDAVDQFIAARLALPAQAGPPGFLCPTAHHYLALQPGTCTYCDSPLITAEDAVDELVEMCLRYGIERNLFIESPELLEPYRGAAAVLYPAVATSRG